MPFSTNTFIITMQTHLRGPAARTRRIALLGTLGLGLALVFSSSAEAQSTDRTVTVTEQVQLGVAPARAWAAIEDFMTWPSWHPAFASTQRVKGDGHSAGTVRLITTRDGAQFTEELISHDGATRSLQYRILASPAPVVGYRSTLAVKPGRDGSTVVWSSDFKVKAGASEEEVKKMIAGIYRLGLDNLATALE
jgi:Polyketide cyclase / dehydrase and lipid transport